MLFKQCALVQYRFYLAENGLAPLVSDANAYLQKIGCDSQAVDEQELEGAIAQFRERGGRAPIQSVENICNANHMLVAHFYHDVYILQLIANAKRGVGWERLNQTLRCTNAGDGIGEALLFQGVYDTSASKDEVLKACNDLARSLGAKECLLRWCLLDAGYFVQLSDTEFVLASPERAQEAVDTFALETFPRFAMYLFKAHWQKEQYDYLIAWMNGEEETPPDGLSQEERGEWKRYRGIIPDLEAETNEAVAFVTENEAAIRVIGSREAQKLIGRIQRLRLSYARLAKAVSDADRMRDTIFANIKNCLDLIDRLGVKEDGGFIYNTRHVLEVTRETLSHELSRYRAVVERTQAVLVALNEHAQELRDLQSQEEARLQSIQASFIAAIASLIGLGQLFTAVPQMQQWETTLKVCSLISAGIVTFAVAHVIFNLKRANTCIDYVIAGVASGTGFLTLYLWTAHHSKWAITMHLIFPPSDWVCIAVFSLGFLIGLGITWLLDKFVGWWVKRSLSRGIASQ